MQRNLKKIILIIVLILLLTTVVCLIFWWSNPYFSPGRIFSGNNEQDFILPREGVYNRLGTVKEVEENEIIIESLSREGVNEVRAIVLPETKFILIENDSNLTPYQNQSSFKEVSFSEITKGDEVSVLANENVTEKNEFTAIRVIIIRKTK